MTVSYTHLDLYKRQDPGIYQWRDQQALYLADDDRGGHLSASQPAD